MRILFVTATRIGDAVLSTGLLSYLIDRHPAARLTIAAGPVAAPLFEAVPRLERLDVIEKLPWSAHWLPFYAAVVTRRWDLVVDLRGSVLAWLLRAGERRVMAKGDAREHRVRQLGRLFDLDPPPSPRLWIAPHHEAAASALLSPGAPILAIGPAANWRGKEWRADLGILSSTCVDTPSPGCYARANARLWQKGTCANIVYASSLACSTWIHRRAHASGRLPNTSGQRAP